MGFVGLTLAVFLASRNIRTTGIEIKKDTLKMLERGDLPFFENGLKRAFNGAMRKKTLDFSDDINGVSNSNIIFICVGTPPAPDGGIRLEALGKASQDVGKAISKSKGKPLVVVKSTVLPNTTRDVVRPLIEKASGKKAYVDFGLVTNPEFLREGSALYDTVNPHLIVIGSDDNASIQKLRKLYEKIYGNKIPKVVSCSTSTAEIIKYANNAFLATKISFINSIANICRHLPETDIEQVAEAIGLDPRIGPLFLKAGPGYGGSCFPKDVSALIDFCNKISIDSSLLKATQEVNRRQPYEVIKIIEDRFNGSLSKIQISILGLSFKKDTDDIREAVSLKIIPELLKHGANIRVHDPMAMVRVKKIFGDDIVYCDSITSCINGADCCVILTEWDEYRKLQPNIFVKYMKTPVVIDARRVFDPLLFEKVLEYHAIGRPDRRAL
jgi:UDPglucose 6-dehydrogenase